MASVYTTSRGKQIDMNRLKLLNETTIAVGNAGVNARGDMVKGGKIIKSREEIAQEQYNISGNNVLKKNRTREAAAEIQADDVPTMNFDEPYHTADEEPVVESSVDAPRGGLASAVSKNQTQRKNT